MSKKQYRLQTYLHWCGSCRDGAQRRVQDRLVTLSGIRRQQEESVRKQEDLSGRYLQNRGRVSTAALKSGKPAVFWHGCNGVERSIENEIRRQTKRIESLSHQYRREQTLLLDERRELVLINRRLQGIRQHRREWCESQRKEHLQREDRYRDEVGCLRFYLSRRNGHHAP